MPVSKQRSSMPKHPVDSLLSQHASLNHLTMQRVLSHVQREQDEWLVNTLMLEGYDVPFRFKRKKTYRSLKGARVDLTFYATTEQVGGFDMEVMNVVRIRQA